MMRRTARLMSVVTERGEGEVNAASTRSALEERATGAVWQVSRRGGGGARRHSMQSTNLPAISDLLKPGQEILVQIAKEPIAKKGARITSHIALPGRFLVFMPTVNHTGVSRKIESDGERRRLKEILLSEKGEAAGGFIVRTAAAGASEEELRSDLRFLLNLWADIKHAVGVVEVAGADLPRPQPDRAHPARPGDGQLLGDLGGHGDASTSACCASCSASSRR